jgi:hypothetical protein
VCFAGECFEEEVTKNILISDVRACNGQCLVSLESQVAVSALCSGGTAGYMIGQAETVRR